MKNDSLLISYSHQDQPFVDALAARLRTEAGLTVWYYPEQPGGVDFIARLMEQIEQARAVLVVLTAQSARSDFVLTEVLHARSARRLLIPLLCEACQGPVTFALNHIHWIDLRDGRDPLPAILQTLAMPAAPTDPAEPLAQLVAIDRYIETIRPQTYLLDLPQVLAHTQLPTEVQICTLGRVPRNTLTIDQDFVSKTHATISMRIETDGFSFVLHDRSRNGTFVNGEPIAAPHMLQDGDTIGFGVRAGMLRFELISETAQGTETAWDD